MHRKAFRALAAALICAALSLCPNPVRAGATLYVSRSGSDLSLNCSEADPCQTVSRALVLAADGDRIEIAPGNYIENLSILKSVTLHGSGPIETVIVGCDAPQSAIYAGGGKEVALEGLTVREVGAASSGAGIQVEGAQVRLTDVRVTENKTGSANGGGVACLSGTLTIERSSIDRNSAAGGGGLWAAPGCTLSMTESVVYFNNARHAAGLWLGGTATLENVTISMNEANIVPDSPRGGGIEVESGGALLLNHVTLADNQVSAGSLSVVATQLWVKPGGQAVLQNTLLEGVDGASAALCAGVVTSGGYNLAGDASCGLSAQGDLPGVTAGLGGLEDHGGPTLTHAFSADSPAVDAADPASLLTDQRGLSPRDGNIDGIVRRDIGAFELQTFGVFLPAILN